MTGGEEQDSPVEAYLDDLFEAVAATLFAAAGCVTLFLGVDAIASSSGRRAGQWLSAAPIAIAAAAWYGVRLLREMRGPAI